MLELSDTIITYTLKRHNESGFVVVNNRISLVSELTSYRKVLKSPRSAIVDKNFLIFYTLLASHYLAYSKGKNFYQKKFFKAETLTR